MIDLLYVALSEGRTHPHGSDKVRAPRRSTTSAHIQQQLECARVELQAITQQREVELALQEQGLKDEVTRNRRLGHIIAGLLDYSTACGMIVPSHLLDMILEDAPNALQRSGILVVPPEQQIVMQGGK